MSARITFSRMMIAIPFILFAHCETSAQKTGLITGIKVNPLGAMASAIPVSIEQFIGANRYSLVLGGSIIHSRAGSGDNRYHSDGFSISPEVRYYFSKETSSFTRTYAGAWLNYEEHTNASPDRLGTFIQGSAFGRGGGILFGNQWFFNNGFLVDLFFGPGYLKFETTESYDLNVSKGGFLVSLTGPKNSGTKVRVGFTVGLAF
jgi:hypothetical protein